MGHVPEKYDVRRAMHPVKGFLWSEINFAEGTASGPQSQQISNTKELHPLRHEQQPVAIVVAGLVILSLRRDMVKIFVKLFMQDLNYA